MIEVTMSGDENISVLMNETTEVQTSDHNQLLNRDMANQHPMSAISGLSDALDEKADFDELPTKVSDLTNDSGFIADAPSDNKQYARKNASWVEVQGGSGAVQSVNGKTGVVVLDHTDVGALSDDTVIPSKTSQLQNDSGYLTQHQSLSGYATETWVEGKGYLTEHQSLSNYYNKSEVDSAISGHHDSTKQDLIDASHKLDYSLIANKPTIPTKTSDLTNDSGFITSHQDISGKEDKSNKVTSLSSASTDVQYPSAKCVYDIVGNVESLLEALL